jgi:hypothetical protein
MTRRRFVVLAGTVGAGLRGLRVGDARADVVEAGGAYMSRPDLKPPQISVSMARNDRGRGCIFLAPFEFSAGADGSGSTPVGVSRSGPLVVDDRGEPLWFVPLEGKTAMGLRVQRFRGRPVLTWYEGSVLGPYGGDFVVYDPTYHEVARVQAGRGRHGDLHEFLLTSEGTALITIYREVTADLSSVGGDSAARLVTGIVQEVDVTSGRVVFEWRSLEHVGVEESFMTGVTPAGNVDYFHLNSVAVDRDGHLLISARHTSTVYKIDRRSGEVMWRLGGKKSDFRIEPAAAFSFQHDARRHRDGTITIFDNGAASPGAGVASRGLRLALDAGRKRASLVSEYAPPDGRTGWAMGNVQQLDDGGVFVGWGTDGSFSEFSRDGRLRYDARFADASVSYRAFRLPWVARPVGRPAVAVIQNGDGTMTVYVSWNGATAVAKWRVDAGTRVDRLATAATQRRTGFETAITLPATTGYLVAVALDAAGRELGATTPVPV